MLKISQETTINLQTNTKKNLTRKYHLPEITTALSTTPYGNKTALTAQPHKLLHHCIPQQKTDMTHLSWILNIRHDGC